ncbi:2,4-diaminopentanoate dehydrogenase [subsurface metagenome]
MGIKVSVDIKSAIKENNKPEVALLATVSSLQKIVPQIEEIAKYGINIISTCEELAFPWDTQPEVARRLDEIAQKYGISILATGVNPGFLMDSLPIAMTGVCQEVRSIKVSRIQDASIRRIPFQKKIAAGLTLNEFEEKKKTGTLRHIGLTESIQMIASKMGWKLDKREEILTPIMAESAGMVAGVQQIGKGYVNGEEKITLLFRAAIGEKNPRDTIEIKGSPEITSTIAGGINGDVATCAIILNAVKSVMAASPGLKTMIDIPPVSFSL